MQEESIAERLIGLTEAIPEPITNVVTNIIDCCFWGTKLVFKTTRQVKIHIDFAC